MAVTAGVSAPAFPVAWHHLATGGGAKERSVCVVECKDECATTAEQL